MAYKGDEKTYFCVDLLSENAIAPERKYNSAGADIYSAERVFIPAQTTRCVNTDVRFHIPPGCYARIAERSGYAKENNLIIKGGVIDRDFKGGVVVIIYNHGKKTYIVEKSERVAQVLLERIKEPVSIVAAPYEKPKRDPRGKVQFTSDSDEESDHLPVSEGEGYSPVCLLCTMSESLGYPSNFCEETYGYSKRKRKI